MDFQHRQVFSICPASYGREIKTLSFRAAASFRGGRARLSRRCPTCARVRVCVCVRVRVRVRVRQLGVAYTFIVEIPCSFLILAPFRAVRHRAAAVQASLQVTAPAPPLSREMGVGLCAGMAGRQGRSRARGWARLRLCGGRHTRAGKAPFCRATPTGAGEGRLRGD